MAEESAAAEPPEHPVRARADITAVVLRLTTVEDWLAGGLSPRHAVTRAMAAPPEGLGLVRRQANRYVGAALARLQQDSTNEPLESKRARMVAMLQAQVQRALTLKRSFAQDGAVVEYDAPDLKAANQAIALLAEIEGVKAPAK